MSKIQLHQFNPIVYPRKLWIATGGTVKELGESFADINDDTKYFDERYFKDAIATTTANLRMRSSGDYGVLVWMPDRSKVNIETVAHEAVHAAIGILRDIHISVDYSDTDDEYLAYLVGFCAGCINQVRTGRFKK